MEGFGVVNVIGKREIGISDKENISIFFNNIRRRKRNEGVGRVIMRMDGVFGRRINWKGEF